MKLLTDLEPYVVWAGRYPFPKKPDELFEMASSSTERELMLGLWDRLSDSLRRIGWITKGDGSILWTDSSRNPSVPPAAVTCIICDRSPPPSYENKAPRIIDTEFNASEATEIVPSPISRSASGIKATTRPQNSRPRSSM